MPGFQEIPLLRLLLSIYFVFKDQRWNYPKNIRGVHKLSFRCNITDNVCECQICDFFAGAERRQEPC